MSSPVHEVPEALVLLPLLAVSLAIMLWRLVSTGRFTWPRAIAGAAACGELLTAMRPAILGADRNAMVESMRSLLSAVDAEALSGETARDAAVSMETGLAGGIDGWLDDDLAFVRDWGFGITQIQTPVLLMHGREDRFVPVAHGEWLAEAIPGVDARIYADEGHISLRVNRLAELYDWLLARMG